MSEQGSTRDMISILQNAKSDNEKLAALMLVPKLLPSFGSGGGLSDGEKRTNDLLDAIDFHFLKRLLWTGDNKSVTSSSGEDNKNDATGDMTNQSQENMSSFDFSLEHISMKNVGLSVLCGFTSVLNETQVTQIMKFIEFTLYKVNQVEISENDGNQERSDAIKMLRKHIVELIEGLLKEQPTVNIDEVIIPSLYRLALKQTNADQILTEIVTLVKKTLESRGTDWITPNSIVAISAIYLQNVMLCEITEGTFTFCGDIVRFMSRHDVKLLPVKLHPLLDSVMGKLYDVLKNKLPADKRQNILQLLTALVQLRGIKSLITARGSKAALLVIHLCSIEVRMTLEEDDLTKVIQNDQTLCACFFALEQMIFYMAHGETTLQLDSKEVLQVHSALQGALSSVIYFLTNCSSNQAIDKQLLGVMAACIRLLGAWTTEETESLQDKYVTLLPSLLQTCKKILGDVDTMKFIIPGLSNLTTDTEPIVEAVIENLSVMIVYVVYCCEQLKQQKEEYEHVLINTCVVILNCIMMPGAKHVINNLQPVLECLSQQTPDILSLCKNVDCCITLIVCGLSVLRKIHELETKENKWMDSATNESFYRHSVVYLFDVISCQFGSGLTPESQNIPEIWLMGVQVLSDLLKVNASLVALLTDAERLKVIMKVFESNSQNADVVFVMEKLMVTIAERTNALLFQGLKIRK